MKRQDNVRDYPEIKIVQWADSDFACYLDVLLSDGKGIYAVDRPIASSAELISQPFDAGYRWTTPGVAKLTFGLGTANSALLLHLGDSYLVRSELVYAWTEGITFHDLNLPSAPGISWATGYGLVVMRCPGYKLDVGGRFASKRHPAALVDPAHFVYAEANEPTADVVTDQQGRSWIKFTGQAAAVHTFRGPGTG